MAYVAVADFRTGTLAEYCVGLTLSTTEASDAQLTAAITRISTRIDQYTNDHFESASATYDLNGSGTSRIYLPARATAITSVSTRDYASNLTVQASTAYRFHSSLNAAGSAVVDDYDWVDVIPGQYLTSVSTPWTDPDYSAAAWPAGAQTIRVIGTFGWLVTPPEIKRATALLVYNSVKPIRNDLGLAQSWTTTDASFDRSVTTPSGLPEVDEIVSRYRRDAYLLVG